MRLSHLVQHYILTYLFKTRVMELPGGEVSLYTMARK